MVQNRTSRDQEWQYDGQVYQLKAREKKPMFEDAAQHGYHKLIYWIDVLTNECGHYLGVEGLTDCSPLDPEEEKPKDELLKREAIPGAEKAQKIKTKVN